MNKTLNSNRATHRGTCQKCGALQKLPNGRLSKHGYTTKWGFFSGVCNGAHELPYEQSCDLIKSYIDWAHTEVARLTAWAEKLESPATEPKAWVHEYSKQSWSYFWREADIVIGKFGYARYIDENGDEKNAPAGVHAHDVLELATKLNASKAWAVRRDIAQLDHYIKWQTDRITHWAPADLKPINASRSV